MAEIIFRMLVTSFRVKKTRTEIFPPTQFRRDVNYTSCRIFFRRIRFDNPNIFLKSEGRTLFISVFCFVLDWVLKEKSTGGNFSVRPKYQIFIWLRAIKTNPMAEIIFRMLVTNFRVKILDGDFSADSIPAGCQLHILPEFFPSDQIW